MDRKWVLLLVLGYLLLVLPVWIYADRTVRVEALLWFSTTYLLAWTLFTLWRIGELLSRLLESETRGSVPPPNAQHDPLRPTIAAPTLMPGTTELPRQVRAAIENAARGLEAVSAGPQRESPEAVPPPAIGGLAPAAFEASPGGAAPVSSSSEQPLAFSVDPLIGRVISAIETPDPADSSVKHLDAGRVRVMVRKLIPPDGPRQVVSDRRRLFRQRLEARLLSKGWRQSLGMAVYTYERTET